MNVLTLGMRNAFRNVVRSISIMLILGLSIGLSLVMLIAHQAVGQKISDVKHSIGNTVTISPVGFSNFSQVNNTLTLSDLQPVQSLAHITSLTETLSDRLTTIGSSSFGRDSTSSNAQTSLTSPIELKQGSGNGGGEGLVIIGGGNLPSNFTPPVSIVGTTDPSKVNLSDVGLKSGQTIDGSKDTNDALVSTDMASKNNLKVGSTFTAYGATLTVVGIFDSGTKAGNNTILVSLPALQHLSNQSEDVTIAIATIDSVDNLNSTTNVVKKALGDKADVTNSADQANQAIQPLANVASISLYSLIGAAVAGGAIIFMTMIMIVRERRREIGILKAIGASNLRIILQFTCEALTLTVLGAVVGLLIGVAGANPVTSTLVSGSSAASSNNGSSVQRFNGGTFRRFTNSSITNVQNIHAVVGWDILAYGFGAAIGIAVVGSTSAGWLIARVRPSEILRLE